MVAAAATAAVAMLVVGGDSAGEPGIVSNVDVTLVKVVMAGVAATLVRSKSSPDVIITTSPSMWL